MLASGAVAAVTTVTHLVPPVVAAGAAQLAGVGFSAVRSVATPLPIFHQPGRLSARILRRNSADQSGRTRTAPRAVAVLLSVAAIVAALTQTLALPWSFAGLAFGLQWGFFLLHGWPERSEKLYDASGSLTHLALIVAGLVFDPLRSPRQIMLSVFTTVWCTRLGTFLFNRISADKEDTRFTEMKTNFWSFSVAWNLQVLWVFLLQLPVLVVNTVGQPALGVWDLLGWSLWCLGFLVEAVADGQKFAFRGTSSNKGKFITTGLWRYSRHPNYFGEILMWIGLCTSCCSCITSNLQWLVWLSPAFNAFLLLFVSGVPMLEKAGEKKWGKDPAYRHYMENTSCIVPWMPASEYRPE
ncbi:unnamed protein product [Effrenium voratum]|uniref:Steroid 5-alpha reductase C-terminal domain-containing protein n=1 Tax=Effrenium voratum TaxID=2562239 RepID=A0AA36MMA8_9DINO|nr:unnamed protein product [Effrenium voratum]CAJ1441026.1 unnamed protein product [Effrenium voratum]